MAWTPAKYLVRGLLDNRRPGRITGWMRLASLPLMVLIELQGDLAGRMRGQRVVLAGDGHPPDGRAARILAPFALHQTGRVLPPDDTPPAPGPEGLYLAWSSDPNGEVVLELEPHQLSIVGEPTRLRPWPAVEIGGGRRRSTRG